VRAASYSAGRNVAEGFVQAFLVVPGHPFRGREFEVVGALPRLATIDQLVVGGVDSSARGVVVTISPRDPTDGAIPNSASRSV
jgi:hypothetical protein